MAVLEIDEDFKAVFLKEGVVSEAMRNFLRGGSRERSISSKRDLTTMTAVRMRSLCSMMMRTSGHSSTRMPRPRERRRSEVGLTGVYGAEGAASSMEKVFAPAKPISA